MSAFSSSSRRGPTWRQRREQLLLALLAHGLPHGALGVRLTAGSGRARVGEKKCTRDRRPGALTTQVWLPSSAMARWTYGAKRGRAPASLSAKRAQAHWIVARSVSQWGAKEAAWRLARHQPQWASAQRVHARAVPPAQGVYRSICWRLVCARRRAGIADFVGALVTEHAAAAREIFAAPRLPICPSRRGHQQPGPGSPAARRGSARARRPRPEVRPSMAGSCAFGGGL